MLLKVSSLSPHNLHLLFCCILSILTLIWLVLIALFCAAIRSDSISLWRFPFLSHVQVFSCEMSLINRLKHSQSCFFFPFLFFSYCRSVGLRVVSIVSGGCNQSSFAFFYVVFESLYRCINAVFNAGKSSSTLLLLLLLRIFHTSVSWKSSTAVWVTVSLFKSPGLFSVFWPTLIMLKFGWPPLVLLFPCPPSLYQSFGDCTECANYNWYHRHSLLL